MGHTGPDDEFVRAFLNTGEFRELRYVDQTRAARAVVTEQG